MVAETQLDRNASPYMRPVEAAAYMHLKPATLAQMRVEGRGPNYYKAGGKVLYKVEDLEAWLEGRKFGSTAEYFSGQ